MRVVVDTNVLVRATIVPHGSVGPVLLRLRQGEYDLLYTQPLLEKLVDVLNRPRSRQKYRLTEEDIVAFLAFIVLRGEVVTPNQHIAACRDPKDDKYLEAALAGGADVIVTGDKDLLALRSFEGIPILTPSSFLRKLDAQKLRPDPSGAGA